MSFRDKSAWISMPSMVAIYGLHFRSVGRAGPRPGRFRCGGLLQTIVALVLVQTAVIIAVAI